MTTADARELLTRITGPAVAADIGGAADLRRAGVGSGDLIRLALLLEEVCDVEMTDADIDALHTLDAIGELLARHASRAESARKDEEGEHHVAR
jgi:acyl carrier protein